MTDEVNLNGYCVAAVQMDIVPGEPETNREHAAELAQVAIGRGARLIVYPELVDIDEVMDGWELATPVPGPFTAPFEALAIEHGVHFVLGMARQVGEGASNSAVFIGPDGVIGAYDKVHPWVGSWDREQGRWKEDPRRIEPHNYLPGEGFRLFEIDGVKVGTLICYDGMFAESWLCYRLMGADLIVWPTNREDYADVDIPALARFFQVAVVAVNRYGQSTYWTEGDSAIISAQGDVLAHAYGGEAVLIADVDIEASRGRRRGQPVMRDRRPEVYARIASPAVEDERASGARSCEVEPIWHPSSQRRAGTGHAQGKER